MSDNDLGGGAERAGRLYWESDATVDEIAGELGISRHALYKQVQPTAAGAACPECGEEMVFANRSQRSARKARCPNCGANAVLSEEQMQGSGGGAETTEEMEGEPVGAGEAEGGGGGWRGALAQGQPGRAAAISGAAAMAGFVLASAVVGAVRRR